MSGDDRGAPRPASDNRGASRFASVAYLREVVLALPATAPAYISVPVPLLPAEDVLALSSEGPAFLWAPPSEPADPADLAAGDDRGAAPFAIDAAPTLVGLGAAALLTPAGPGRLPLLREQAERLLGSMILRPAPGLPPIPPRILGALAFAPGAAQAPPWTAFGDAVFLLPRWTYCSQGDVASLSMALPGDEGEAPAARAARAAAELEALLDGLRHAGERARAAPRRERSPAIDGPAAEGDGLLEQDLASWTAQIEDIRAAIRAGEFRKIVAARRALLPLAAPLRDTAVLAWLRGEQPGGTRFALRRGGATFLGATPERLLRKRGAALYTEALAGSIPISGDGEQAARAAAQLQASAKDREEHDLVVQDLRARLAPLCAHLEAPAVPEVRALRQMLHLLTPVRGTLRQAVHALDLLDALHPTPAVGGVPREASLRWIERHEPAPRGLYAGPLGWFDAAGDGEFMVAIRSGLLTPTAAYVYAGAGITADSDPTAEYAETGLKQQALLRALRAARDAADDADDADVPPRAAPPGRAP